MPSDLQPSPLSCILAEPDWQARRAGHVARVQEWTGPHQARARLQHKHPVYDFLFSYYHFRPGQLETWHPGLGVTIAGASAEDYLALPGYHRTAEGITADPAWYKPERHEGLRWITQLLRVTTERPPSFGCFGLHEWAMVYRTPEVRHAAWPLRFPPDELAAIVEAQTIRCSHFDAFRFFTDAARPLNRLQPSKLDIPHLEQRGCLHANMDLYKWAFKLAPYTPSELIADAFELACEIRETDMRASPYDLRSLGFEPIPIETPEGRIQYETLQRNYSERGIPLRARLLTACEALVAALG